MLGHLLLNSTQSTLRLTDSYARWRSSRLGRITDALEQQLLFELLGPVAGKVLLDVGCGDGALASELARRGAAVTGLDADPAIIAAARRRAQAAAMPLQFVEGQAESLPFESGSFDLVLAVTVLCFVRDAERAVSEMARVLKPGGRLVIGELGRWSLWAAYRRIRGWIGTSRGELRHSAQPGSFVLLLKLLASMCCGYEERCIIRPGAWRHSFRPRLTCGSAPN